MATWKRKPSERLVSCYYGKYDELQIEFKNLGRHTERAHGPSSQYPPREKGQRTLLDCMLANKQAKVNPAEEKSKLHPEDNSSATSSLTLTSFTAVFSAFQSLLGLLNPFREAVGSIEKLATRLEALFEEKNVIREDWLKTYVIYEDFAHAHAAEGLVVRSSRSKFYGLCKLCMKHSADLSSVKNFQEDWVVSGSLLNEYKCENGNGT